MQATLKLQIFTNQQRCIEVFRTAKERVNFFAVTSQLNAMLQYLATIVFYNN